MKITKKILIGLVSCSMILSGGAVTPTASAKSTKVIRKGYTISKKAGTYSASVKVKVKAKKGYTVYYTTTGKLKKSHRIKSSKTKTFTFKQTKTLRIYVVKATKKTTAKKLRKVKKSAMAKYKYRIIKQSAKSTATPNANITTASPAATIITTTTAPSVTQTPSASSTPLGTPASTATAVPMVTPGASDYVGDDASVSYVEPTRTTYSEEDMDTSSDNATEITLSTSATGSKVTADNYEISKKNKLTITAPGTYILHSAPNETTDGLVEVKYADDASTGTVHIILDGVRLTSSTNTAPDSDTGLITIKSNVTNAVITIADGSENTLTDTGATGIDEDDNTITYTAGILSKKTPLTINGSGTLNVISSNGNGVKCTNELKILDAVINVSGPNDTSVGHNGISGKTGLSLKNATIFVHANNDAVKTTLDADDISEDSALADLGNMELDSGNYTIVSENGDGISAYRTLYLNPTLLKVTTKNAASSTEDSSYKGIKSGTTIYVPSTAGTIITDTTATYSSSRASGDSNDSVADDTLHCNGTIKIDGGTFTLASGDDGIHADAGLVINNGTINISECYEGLEAADITINGGIITITSRDDGLNAAGGNNVSSDSGNRFPDDSFHKPENSSSTQYQIIINGGTITVNAQGDGIDSNGNIFFKGGTVIVNGPTSGGNGALDYGDSSDCVCEISGGTLIAAGAVGMDVAPTNGSSQPAVNVHLSSTQSANTYVILKDSDGNTVLTAQPTKSFQSIVLSCEAMTLGNTYTIYYGKDLNSLTQGDSITLTSTSMSTGSSSSSGGWNAGGNRPGGRM